MTDDTTEQLTLGVGQPNEALDSLLAKIQKLKLEMKGLAESSNRLQNIKPFFPSATYSRQVAAGVSTPPRIAPSSPIDYRNLQGLQQAMSGLNIAAGGPVSGIGALSKTFGQLKTYVANVTAGITQQMTAARAALGGLGGLGGGGVPPGGVPRAGASPASGQASSLGLATRRVAAYATAGAGLAGLLGSVSEIVRLDNELRNLQAITRTSDAGMVSLRKNILEVATSSRFLSTEVAQAAVTLGQAGLSASQIGEALKSVVNLATASGTSLENAVNITTSAMGSFGLAAGEVKDVANLFTAALNTSKLTIDQLSQGFSYSSNAASQLGVSYQELTALLASLSDAGIKSGSTLGTGLRSIFNDLVDPSEKLQRTLARLGVSLDDIDVRTKSFSAVLNTLHNAGFTAADAFATLETRSAAAYVALQGQASGFAELQRSILATSAASEAAATQMLSLQNTARQTASIFTSLASVSFQPILDGLQQALVRTNIWGKGLTDARLSLEAIGVVVAGLATSVGIRFLAGLGGVALGATGVGFLGLAGLSTALVAIVAAAGAAKGKLDSLTASVEQAKGVNEQAKTQYEEVEKAVSDLLTKETSLRANKEELKTTTILLGERFRSLGLDVAGLGGNFDELLAKMKALDVTSQKALQGSLDLLSARQGVELNVLKAQGGNVTSGIKNKLFGPTYYDEANPYGIGRRTTATYAGVGGGNVAKFLARLNTGISLGENDFNLVQNAQAELLRSGDASDNAKAIADALEKALAYVSQIRSKLDAKQSTDKALSTATRQGSLAFKSLEEGARQLYAQLNSSIPRRDANDPVGTEQRLTAFLSQHGTEIKQYEDAYTAYGARGDAETGAVSQSSALRDLTGIRTQVQRELQAVKDVAGKIRDELANLLTGEVEAKLKNLERQISRADTNDDLTDLSVQISETIRELYQRKAAEFAQKTLGLAPGEFDVAGFGQLNLHPLNSKVTATQQAQVRAFNAQFSEQNVAGALVGIGARSDVIDDRVRAAQIKTIGIAMSTLDKQISDAFKNTDDNSPASLIRERAQQSLDNLAQWYSLALDALDKEFNHGNNNGKLTAEDYLARKQSLEDQYDSRRDEANDRTKKLPFDYSRPLTGSDSVFSNVATYLGPSERESVPGFDATKNTWSETMIAGITDVRQNFGSMFTDIETGQVKALEGFKTLSRGILQSMLQVINDSIAKSFLQTIKGFLPSLGGSSGGLDLGDISGGDVAGHALGGSIKRYAGGGSNRDSVLAKLTPGEFVMRTSAVEAIGRDNLERINSMGNSRKSLGGIQRYEKSEPVPVNVWVVAKDRIPQMGKNDVLAIVSDDMITGGVTKKLVRSISAGH